MKLFEFSNGQKLKVNGTDYELLKKISGMRFTHIGMNAQSLIDQIQNSIEIDESTRYINRVIDSSSSESIAVVNRLILNQLLHLTSQFQRTVNEVEN